MAVECVELLYGLGERVGRGVGGEDVRGEESETEAEVGRGEDGQRLDQDVGDGLLATKMGVELVAVLWRWSVKGRCRNKVVCAGAGAERAVEEERRHSQLEQGQVRVAVIGLVFALRHDVILENSRGLGVVAVQSVQDGINVLWPLGRVVEGDTHVVCD